MIPQADIIAWREKAPWSTDAQVERDIFDITVSVKHFPKLSRGSVVKCFHKYMEHGGHKVSRAEYEKNLAEKAQHPAFSKDIGPLLSIDGGSDFQLETVLALVRNDFLPLLPGEPWSPPDKKA